MKAPSWVGSVSPKDVPKRIRFREIKVVFGQVSRNEVVPNSLFAVAK